MSRERAIEFIAYIEKSPAIQQEIEGYTGAGALNRLADLGAEHGFSFTVEEYREAVVELADGELSDEALQEVLREAGLE